MKADVMSNLNWQHVTV